jgi:hypothetical protein
MAAPLTPLTKPEDKPDSTPLPPGKFALRLLAAVFIWLVANLVTFILVAFIIFMLLAGPGAFDPDFAFTLSILCAIPPALTVSSLLAGRKIFYTISKRYH